MTPPKMRTAAKLSSHLSKSGGYRESPVSKACTDIYSNSSLSAMDLAVSVISRRHRLSPSTARVVCQLAGIGGA
ncbi:hypothetical protein REJC140_03863 [Pseudorhizobium endolithicum]|uniref:Uncharacterized protein n=1 Tax=Pseudorhizobium endolithicum TaxID=1191678 RepID=A0ABM8PRN8_9HYPH|nr:hypothetical protein REJC140_03863 [Pseudorhizobium endolithicum]